MGSRGELIQKQSDYYFRYRVPARLKGSRHLASAAKAKGQSEQIKHNLARMISDLRAFAWDADALIPTCHWHHQTG